MARQAINEGKTANLLSRYSQLSSMPDILKKITDDKQIELTELKKKMPLEELFRGIVKSERSFKAALAKPNSLNLIAEIKNASPTAGEIYAGEQSAADIAGIYEKNGADAISVLTDKKYFKGSLENLDLARSATKNVPLLMKDFIIDEYQIYLARYHGADAILLIASILTENQINWFTSIAKTFDMDVLLEVHDERELKIALRSKADIIGINNRDLHTFEIDVATFLKLYPKIGEDKIIVAESGYNQRNVQMIKGMANAVLIGTSIMQSKDMAETIAKIKMAKKKFKPCGIRTIEEAKHCEEAGVELVGLNFVPSSKRCIDLDLAKEISKILKSTAIVGVFQDQSADEVNRIADEVGLDFIQLSGNESPEYCLKIKKPVIKTLKIGDQNKASSYDRVVAMFIIDSRKPGSGTSYNYAELNNFRTKKPFLVAGGVNEYNVSKILTKVPGAAGVDIASGIETDEKVDLSKIDHIANKVSNLSA